MYDEPTLITQLQQGSERAFTLLFRRYYKDLVLFAGLFLPEREVCEDIVQSVFVAIWEKRAGVGIHTSFRSFLLKSVKNGCLDELRHRKVVWEHEADSALRQSIHNVSTEQYVFYSELASRIDEALAQLPEKQREVFEMSRIRHKIQRHRQSAEHLGTDNRRTDGQIDKNIAQSAERLLAASVHFALITVNQDVDFRLLNVL